MPRESSILADICCDFCFSRDGTPFTRGSTATGTRTRGRAGVLMKTQEASWRKIRPLPEEPSVVTYTYLSTLSACKVWMSFHYSLMLQSLLRPLYWCILGGRISLNLSFAVANSRIAVNDNGFDQERDSSIPITTWEKYVRSLSISLAFHSNGYISESLLLAFPSGFFFNF